MINSEGKKPFTNSPLGVALYTILGALAQLEREMIIERVRAGMANAKAKGKRIGRVKKKKFCIDPITARGKALLPRNC